MTGSRLRRLPTVLIALLSLLSLGWKEVPMQDGCKFTHEEIREVPSTLAFFSQDQSRYRDEICQEQMGRGKASCPKVKQPQRISCYLTLTSVLDPDKASVLDIPDSGLISDFYIARGRTREEVMAQARQQMDESALSSTDDFFRFHNSCNIAKGIPRASYEMQVPDPSNVRAVVANGEQYFELPTQSRTTAYCFDANADSSKLRHEVEVEISSKTFE